MFASINSNDGLFLTTLMVMLMLARNIIPTHNSKLKIPDQFQFICFAPSLSNFGVFFCIEFFPIYYNLTNNFYLLKKNVINMREAKRLSSFSIYFYFDTKKN